jgi:serine/threonine protein kinase
MVIQWQRVEGIFHDALERPPSARRSFLREACSGDDALAREIARMLRRMPPRGAFSSGLRWNCTPRLWPPRKTTACRLVTSLGVYRIVSLLGAGGMGEVYLADDTELGRQVALKLVKRGFGRAGIARQLRQEARILAGFNDPHIARLYGVGITPEGIPYFIMEYVDGEGSTITAESMASQLTNGWSCSAKSVRRSAMGTGTSLFIAT